MGIFTYRAVSREGKRVAGRVEASNTQMAAASVQEMGLIALSVEADIGDKAVRPARGRLQLQRITRKDMLLFTEELSTLVRAGLPLDKSLEITAELAAKPALRKVIKDVLKQIKGGGSLADGLSAHPKQFSKLYVNMVRAGEAGGILDVILERLTEFERSADELRSYVSASLVYPALLATVGLGSVAILFYFVIPRFAGIFEDVGAQIPPSTLVLIAIANFSRSYWWLVLAALGLAVISGRAFLRSPEGARTWDRVQLRIPLLGSTILKLEVARFAGTLGTLIRSGVPLIAAVRIVEGIANNRVLADAISRIADGAKRGEGVAGPMADAGLFPGLAVHLVAVGEETGRLDTMLIQVAEVYEKDVRSAVKMLTSVFEPAIILVMGVLIGGVVLSMLTAIFSINDIAF